MHAYSLNNKDNESDSMQRKADIDHTKRSTARDRWRKYKTSISDHVDELTATNVLKFLTSLHAYNKAADIQFQSSSWKSTAILWTARAPVRSLPGRRSLRSVPIVFWCQWPSDQPSAVVISRLLVHPKTWNAVPEDVTSSQSEYIFRRQLKSWLFKKSFPDIIIWYWLHLDF